jgi:hypothetical protein
VLSGVVQRQQMLPLCLGQFRLLAFQPALGFGDRHAFTGAHPDQVRLKPATIPRTLNSSRPTGSVGRGAPTETKHDPFGGQFIGYVPSIGKGTRQAVDFGHHERVTGPARYPRLPQTGRTRFTPVRPWSMKIWLFIYAQAQEGVSQAG